jgi:alpha-galactosidase
VEFNLISLSWNENGAAAYRVTRSDGQVSTEPVAMFVDTKFPRENPLTYTVEALGGDGKAAAPVSIKVTPLTKLTAPPVPPLPTISLNATNTKFVQNTAGTARFGLSYTGKPLSIDGKTYENGYGTHANAIAVATIPKGATRFVATVGIDDAARQDARASVIFEVYGDVNEMGEKPVLLAQSPVLTTMELSSWNFNVELNTRFKEVRLVVKDAGDSVHSDHADWVNAGFIVPVEP